MRGWIKLLAAIAVLGGTLWTHGCHIGGHDDDLNRRWPTPQMQR
ncbi:MAG TPA: hypothetical protein PKC45_08585 [Gemmatales bacterium]|nr:hypothetical protein [Gemmatales bacterium]